MATSDEVDVRGAARLAGRTTETIRRWVWSGRLPARKQGNRLILQRRDVEALAAHDAETPSFGEWAKQAESALRRHAGPRRSAADLLLEERERRLQEVRVHAGR